MITNCRELIMHESAEIPPPYFAHNGSTGVT